MIDFTKPIQTRSGYFVSLRRVGSTVDYPIRGYIGIIPELMEWNAGGKMLTYPDREDWDLINPGVVYEVVDHQNTTAAQDTAVILCVAQMNSLL